MRLGFGSFALALSLASSMAGASGSTCANRATAMAGARIVAPAKINETLMPRGTDVFVSGITGDLIIRLPSEFTAETNEDRFRSVITRLQERVDTGCADRGDCFRRADQEGLLDGDPVSGIILKATDDSPSGMNGISITVTYN